MTKADIIEQISDNTGISKKDVSIVVEAFMDEVKGCIVKGEENVYLRGFGTFGRKHRATKTARNISKNTTLIVEAHDIPSFKPSKAFSGQMK